MALLIAGNWKMYKTGLETALFCTALGGRVDDLGSVDVVVCPPYTSLDEAVQALGGTTVDVFAQSAHWASEGPFTGEISATMLAELGVTGSLVAHSERRQLFAETDETAARRIDGLLAAGLRVLACVGETESERDEGRTEEVLARQIEAIAAVVPSAERTNLTVAYEPVWAIGTGRTATPEQAQAAHAFIHSFLEVPVLYGGSVKPENAEELLDQGDVDGALVGGASLELESFVAICETAARVGS